MTVIGVISDTHGLLRPEAIEHLQGSEIILHAGDIGAPDIIGQLEQIAPVTAVRGNVDTAPWTHVYPLRQVIDIGEIRIHMVHDIADLGLDPAAEGINAVIYGHSHIPKSEDRTGVLFFNPGSAGPQRFRLPISLGRLTVTDTGIAPELFEIQI